MDKERDGFPLTAIREVNILLSFHHAAIVDVSEARLCQGLQGLGSSVSMSRHKVQTRHHDTTSGSCLLPELLMCAGCSFMHAICPPTL